MNFSTGAHLATSLIIIAGIISSVASILQATYKVEPELVDSVTQLLNNEKFNSTALNIVLSAGNIDGFYTPDQLYGLIQALNKAYPQYITSTIPIGESYQSRPILAYQLGEIKSAVEKSVILFTALHHSREPLSLAMIIKITLVKLHELIHRGPETHMFDFSDILFLPIINIDGYTHIAEHYGKPHWNVNQLKRKNFNHTVPCKTEDKHADLINSGVDLNRNYDYKFAFDDEGSVPDPCDEIYRGPAPFSEYETQAVKYLVESSGKIVSAMNFHAYGNLWITPFCYYKDPDYEKLMAPEIYRFYRSFEAEIRNLGFKKAGNAEETIQYVANGEASDWMLARHNIISFSPELGNDQPDTDKFFPPKSRIAEILDFDFPVIKTFFSYHRPIIQNVRVEMTGDADTSFNETVIFASKAKNATELPLSTSGQNQQTLKFEFEHRGIIDIHNLRVVVKFTDPSFGTAIQKVHYLSGKGAPVEIAANPFLKKNKLICKKLVTLKKLSDNQFTFVMASPMKPAFRLLFYKGKKKVFEVASSQDQKYVAMMTGEIKMRKTYLACVFLFVMSFILIGCWIGRRVGARSRSPSEKDSEESFEQHNLKHNAV